jgi:hypothetical protein
MDTRGTPGYLAIYGVYVQREYRTENQADEELGFPCGRSRNLFEEGLFCCPDQSLESTHYLIVSAATRRCQGLPSLRSPFALSRETEVA